MKTNLKKILFQLTFAALTGALVPNATATPFTFWFSGTIDNIYNPSNALPAGIFLGTPFSGRVTYDSALVASAITNSYASGSVFDAYFKQIAGFAMLVQIGGHTITNALNPDGFSNCGYVGVYDQFNNSDELNMDTAHANIIVDGQSTLVGNAAPYLSLYLQDATKTAYSAATWPTTPPTIGQFSNQRAFSWAQQLDDGFNTTVYWLSGTINVLTTNELVTLSIRRAGNNTVQLTWPTGISNFTLQSTTNLAAANWQAVTNAVTDVNMEHTTAISSARKNQFFRLKK